MKFYTPEELQIVKKRRKVAMYAGIMAGIILIAAVIPFLTY